MGSLGSPGLKEVNFFLFFGGPSGIVVGSVVSVEVASLARRARECARQAGSRCLLKLSIGQESLGIIRAGKYAGYSVEAGLGFERL